jgi:DMSO/TMAO reductase YedYZ molybdopterin-dependent catalytic subunit
MTHTVKYYFIVLTVSIYLLAVGNLACDSATTSRNVIEGDEVDSTEEQMVKLPGKKPLKLLSDRPPNFETPLRYFLLDLTPNDVFFVRWHLSGLPSAVGEDTFRLRIGGNVKRKLALSMHDLKTRFKPYSTIAVCACSGNARSCFKPRVPGAQWVNGGMGNAKWTGVRLKDVLEMAGVNSKSGFVSFNGLDAPPLSTIPDFVKSLSVPHAMDGEVMIAYEMNGEPIPLLNGYPLKLVVPGWFATYWVGMLNEVQVYRDTFKGFWMDKAYLIPKGSPNGDERPDSLAKVMEPINKMNVRSIFVAPEPGTAISAGKVTEVQGLAFDGGDGIVKVEISSDSGRTWVSTQLDASLGRYSWRRWRYQFRPPAKGKYKFYVKATNAAGDTQPWRQWNRSGYMRNEIESLILNVD